MTIQFAGQFAAQSAPIRSVTFHIFRTGAGRWCAAKSDGLVAGTFFDHDAAVRFAERESCGCRLRCIEDECLSRSDLVGPCAAGVA